MQCLENDLIKSNMDKTHSSHLSSLLVLKLVHSLLPGSHLATLFHLCPSILFKSESSFNVISHSFFQISIHLSH